MRAKKQQPKNCIPNARKIIECRGVKIEPRNKRSLYLGARHLLDDKIKSLPKACAYMRQIVMYAQAWCRMVKVNDAI